jgi:hypothetical protein
MLVRTHNRPGVFYQPQCNIICMSLKTIVKLTNFVVHPLVPTAPNNSMSRIISQLTAGKLCVEIRSDSVRTGIVAFKFEFEMLNLDTNRLETSFRENKSTIWSILEFDNLQPGNYQLTLRNIRKLVSHIELRPSI